MKFYPPWTAAAKKISIGGQGTTVIKSSMTTSTNVRLHLFIIQFLNDAQIEKIWIF